MLGTWFKSATDDLREDLPCEDSVDSEYGFAVGFLLVLAQVLSNRRRCHENGKGCLQVHIYKSIRTLIMGTISQQHIPLCVEPAIHEANCDTVPTGTIHILENNYEKTVR